MLEPKPRQDLVPGRSTTRTRTRTRAVDSASDVFTHFEVQRDVCVSVQNVPELVFTSVSTGFWSGLAPPHHILLVSDWTDFLLFVFFHFYILTGSKTQNLMF